MKSIIAAGILLASAPAALAFPVDGGFSQGQVSRGEPYAVRACGDVCGTFSDVCYGQWTRGEFFPFSRGVGIEVDRYKTVRVSCDRPHVEGTRRGNMAKEYCPEVRAGNLAPAPFLD